MPLEILLVLVVGGIACIALALHLLGLSAAPGFDAAGARDAWLRHFPQDAVTDAAPSRDGRAARIEAASGKGIVWRFGADSVARPLAGARAEPHKTGLILRLPDYAAPRVRLTLTPEEARAWARWMQT
ncbi:MAG: hypothetical protein AAGF60_02975 [Pseudomonadota bacterium]